MESPPWLALALLAVATSGVSAVVGMAGGLLLLAALLTCFDPWVAIPVHGVVQLASNASRAYLQRAHVERRAVWHFAALLLPAGWAGLAVTQAIAPAAGRLTIGLFLLVATWLPSWLGRPAALAPRDVGRRFLVAGALVGFANMVVGGTGPVVAPFVLSLPLARQGVIGTLAACQTLGHLAKIGLFAGAGFAFREYALPLVALCAGAVVGSALGTRVLARLDERRFRRWIRIVLTALGAHLLWRGLAGL